MSYVTGLKNVFHSLFKDRKRLMNRREWQCLVSDVNLLLRGSEKEEVLKSLIEVLGKPKSSLVFHSPDPKAITEAQLKTLKLISATNNPALINFACKKIVITSSLYRNNKIAVIAEPLMKKFPRLMGIFKVKRSQLELIFEKSKLKPKSRKRLPRPRKP